jgi:hypothetical protein
MRVAAYKSPDSARNRLDTPAVTSPIRSAATRGQGGSSFNRPTGRSRSAAAWRLGGVCLVQIPAESGTGRSAIAASQTNCGLPPGPDGHPTCSHTCQLVTAVPGSVPHASGYLDRQRSTAAARLATSHRGQRTQAGR